jgi:hypothetical protein
MYMYNTYIEWYRVLRTQHGVTPVVGLEANGRMTSIEAFAMQNGAIWEEKGIVSAVVTVDILQSTSSEVFKYRYVQAGKRSDAQLVRRRYLYLSCSGECDGLWAKRQSCRDKDLQRRREQYETVLL